MENRIIDLEIRLTHQEATVQTLNDVVIRQEQIIDRLMRELEALRRQMRQMEAAGSPMGRPEDEPPPPHY